MHPEQAETIRPELEGALWLVSQRQEVEARPGFVTASRKRVVERIKAEAKSQGAKHGLFGFAWPQRFAYQWIAGLAVILLMLLGTGGVVTISQNSLPGDGLYAVKRISEQVSYSVTLGQLQRVQLSAQFTERRMDEVETLLARGNYPAAMSALNDYEQQVSRTIDLLEQASNAAAKQKLGVAVAFKDSLVRNAERIEALLVSAPPIARADLQQAREATRLGAALIDDMIDDMPVVDVTGTPTPTLTPTLAETPTPFFTDTPVPSGTPVLEALPKNPDRPTVTPTPGSGDPTATLAPKTQPTAKIKPSNTPKPANTPKPEKTKNNNTDKDKTPPGKDK